jgi:hypothetical protein
MEPRRGLDRFADDAQGWRAAVGPRVPAYDRLLEAAVELAVAPADPAERAARERLEAAWRERRFAAAYDRPLLLLASLRAEAFRAGAAHPLHAAIAGEPPRPEAATRGAVAEALAEAPARLFVDLATRWVQTNETSRAVAWLWPAALAGAGGGARLLALADVGCSAGLNLIADRLSAPWLDAGGAPLPVGRDLTIVARRGFDARPLDVRRAEDAAWLRACVWPGETGRLARLNQAIAAFVAELRAPAPPELDAADLGDVPGRLDALAGALPPGALLLAYQTVVRDYLPPEARAAHAERVRAWVAAGGAETRVYVELEAAPDPWQSATGGTEAQRTAMALTAHVRGVSGEAEALVLARCGYHPSLVVPDARAVAAFVARTAAVQHPRSPAA